MRNVGDGAGLGADGSAGIGEGEIAGMMQSVGIVVWIDGGNAVVFVSIYVIKEC